MMTKLFGSALLGLIWWSVLILCAKPVTGQQEGPGMMPGSGVRTSRRRQLVYSRSCTANKRCAQAGNTGNCCPTDDGKFLACCPTRKCRRYPACAQLSGRCCPDNSGLVLDCCFDKSEGACSANKQVCLSNQDCCDGLVCTIKNLCMKQMMMRR